MNYDLQHLDKKYQKVFNWWSTRIYSWNAPRCQEYHKSFTWKLTQFKTGIQTFLLFTHLWQTWSLETKKNFMERPVIAKWRYTCWNLMSLGCFFCVWLICVTVEMCREGYIEVRIQKGHVHLKLILLDKTSFFITSELPDRTQTGKSLIIRQPWKAGLIPNMTPKTWNISGLHVMITWR